MDQQNEQAIASLHSAARARLDDMIGPEKVEMLAYALKRPPQCPWRGGSPLQNTLDDMISLHDHDLIARVVANLACIAPLTADDLGAGRQIDLVLHDIAKRQYRHLTRNGDKRARVKIVDLFCSAVLPAADELRLRLELKPKSNVARFRPQKLAWPTDVAAFDIIKAHASDPQITSSEGTLILNLVTQYMHLRGLQFSKAPFDGRDEKTRHLADLQKTIWQFQRSKIASEQERLSTVRPDNVVHLAFGRPASAPN